VHFKFLSDAEFFRLSEDDKAVYLAASVKEVAKMAALLHWHGQKPGTPDLPAFQGSARGRSEWREPPMRDKESS